MTWAEVSAAASSWGQLYGFYVLDGYVFDGYFDPDWQDWSAASESDSTWATSSSASSSWSDDTTVTSTWTTI